MAWLAKSRKAIVIKKRRRKVKVKKTYKFWLCIALVLIVISMFFSSAIASSWNNVRVTKINIAAPEGQNVNAVLYTPKDASAENKLPLVLVCHGSYNSKEMQAQNYVELSRRGFVVCTIDSYCHGLSSVENGDNGTIDSTDRYTCMIHTLEYLMATLDYIDMDKIGLEGHSMGGFHCNDTVSHYLNEEYFGVKDNPISAVLNMGCEPYHTYWGFIPSTERLDADSLVKGGVHEGMTEAETEPIPVDIDYGLVAAYNDEWFWTNDEGNPHYYLSEDRAKLFINQIGDMISPDEDVENGKYYYGDVNGRETFRVIYVPHQIHPLNSFSRAGAYDCVEFFYNAFGTPAGHEYIEPSNQVWFIKELFNLLGLIGIFILIVPLTCLLMKTPFFSELEAKGALPANPGPNDKKGKLVFAISWVICALIPSLLVMPLMFWLIGQGTVETYISDIPHVWNHLFGQTNTNELSVWTGIVGLCIGLILFISYKLYGEKAGQTRETLGLSITGKKLWKSILLALSVITVIYVITFFADWAFTTDFRFWMIAVKVFNAENIMYTAIYMIPFIIFYLVNSAAVNGFNRINIMKEWQSTVLTCVGNVIGILLMIIIQYATLDLKGSFVWNPMRIYNLVPLVVLIPTATIISRKLFKKTNNVYLAGILFGLFYTIMICANTMTRGSMFLG